MKKEAALGKDGIKFSFRMMTATVLQDVHMACPVWGMLEEWYDSIRLAEELGDSSSQKAV